MAAIIARIVISATKTWHRWCGPRSELVRATETASDALRAWTGYDSVIEVRVEDRAGVTETGRGIDVLTSRHAGELRSLIRVHATVEPDRDQWMESVVKARRSDEDSPGMPNAKVEIGIAKYGTTLNVSGDDRTSVEGLMARLTQDLGRAATNVPGFSRDVVAAFSVLIVGLGVIAGLLVPHWVGAVPRSQNEVATVEIIGSAVGGIAGVVLAFGLWWLFPPVELFGEGGAGRARRFRGWIIAGALALAVGIGGSFIYDRIT